MCYPRKGASLRFQLVQHDDKKTCLGQAGERGK